MNSLTFKAVIGAVHFDPKKGIVKLSLEATSFVSLDKLTSLGPTDESIKVTLESPQTKITNVGDPITPTEAVAKKLKEAAERLESEEERERQGGII
jgi:hypothetical protein